MYFPKLSGRADWEKGEIKLFCNQVFVSDSIKEIVPKYLLPLRGVIDSTDIPLNVSRSALQTDRKVRSISSFISKKIANKLKDLIKKYCDFMPIDVLLEGETINKKNPPWRKQPSELKDEDYIELYKYLYPFQGDPLLWIHLNTDYPYDIQGILYLSLIHI